MLFYLLFSNTIHFAVMVVAALVFFSTGLIYLDSSNAMGKRNRTLIARTIGFFLLSLVYVSHATAVTLEPVVLASQIVKIVGLALILISLVKEPLLGLPKAGLITLPFAVPAAVISALIPLSAVLMLLVSIVYLRKATEGMERQIKPVAFAFLFLGISETVKVSFAWADSSNVFLAKLLAQFGTAWNIADGLALMGIIILGAWVWGYVRFRLQIQIFVLTLTRSIFAFLVITFFFTFLLLNNLQEDALGHLATDVKVMQYAIDGLGSKTMAYAQAVAQSARVRQAVVGNDISALYTLSDGYMASQKTNSLIIATASGQVLVRGENKGLANDNVGSDPIFEAATTGESVSTIVYSEGVTVPEISIESAVPIFAAEEDSTPIGVVITGLAVNNAFVDGVKSVTGLDTGVFGGNKRSATTFVSQDGKSRFTGTIEANTRITDAVLNRSETYIGTSSIFNEPYFVAYTPLKTYEGKVVGMLFTGKPQSTLTEAAKKSINLTFLGSAVLIVLSIIPTYFVSEYIKRNLDA